MYNLASLLAVAAVANAAPAPMNANLVRADACTASYDGVFGIVPRTIGASSGASKVVSQISDGQPQAPTPVSQIGDGQPQAPTGAVSQIGDGQPQAPTGVVSQIGDGQPQAPTGVVSQIGDGQPQAPTGVVSQIGDGQPQAPTGVVSQIGDGQPQAPTGAVSQIGDGQPQAPTGAVSQIGDGQPQAPTPVSQIGDGQPQAPTKTSAPSSGTGCKTDGALMMTLENGNLKDSKGRIGSIVANDQFQFDGPPAQAGAKYTTGWGVCDGHLALNGKTTFYRCLSGNFYNLYDTTQGGQCEAVTLDVLKLVSC